MYVILLQFHLPVNISFVRDMIGFSDARISSFESRHKNFIAPGPVAENLLSSRFVFRANVYSFTRLNICEISASLSSPPLPSVYISSLVRPSLKILMSVEEREQMSASNESEHEQGEGFRRLSPGNFNVDRWYDDDANV